MLLSGQGSLLSIGLPVVDLESENESKIRAGRCSNSPKRELLCSAAQPGASVWDLGNGKGGKSSLCDLRQSPCEPTSLPVSSKFRLETADPASENCARAPTERTDCTPGRSNQ